MTLAERFRRMPDDELARHLMTRTNVVLPDAPPATSEALAAADRILTGRWRLIGEEYELGDDFSWRPNPSSDKEWQIAQHKHYFAPELLQAFLATGRKAYLSCWQKLLSSWLDEMGTGFVAASDSQVEALRLRNWVDSYVLLRLAHERAMVPADFRGDLLRRWVERAGEEAAYVAGHLKSARNHRTFQLSSVFVTTVCFPEIEGASDLARLAADLLTENLLTDLLPDGVQVEMSTHYHQLVAETAMGFLQLAGRNRVHVAPELIDRVHRAARWSMWLQWPDGHIPLIGDSDDGDHGRLLREAAAFYQDPNLLWAATRGREGAPPARPSAQFPDSGYLVFTDGWGTDEDSFRRRTHVLYDAARLGAGAHAHYDLFSFTYFTGGRPVVVDPGRFTYSGEDDADGTNWRHVFKSTAAHNTVVVDGRDQTRHVSRNKHGPEARPVEKQVHIGRRGDWVVAAVSSAEYSAVHTRLAVHVLREYLLLVDRVSPADDEEHTATASFHLAPGSPAAVVEDGETGCLDADVARIVFWVGKSARAGVEQGWVSTTYGVKEPAPVLRVTASGRGELLLASAIAPVTTAAGPLSISRMSTAPGEAPGFTVELEVAGKRYTDTVLVSRGGIATPGVVASGRFVLIRRDSQGRVCWLTGEGLAGSTWPADERVGASGR